ncbi:hypothetical protein P3T36_003416 [Kitasatospora sp. MAP12-15]|nr:hypothetical protein [Kitasatospora sp. MAP12-44]
MRNEADDPLINVLGVAEEACSVQRVEPGVCDSGRVADVMQDRGGFEQPSVLAEDQPE